MLRTKLCDLLDIQVPVMLAGMGGIANKELVAAVTNAGGFGTWGSAIDVKNKGPEELLEDLKEISRMCNGKPFGVDILVQGAEGGVMKQLIQIFAEGGAKAFISGKGFPRKENIDAFHEHGMLVGSIAGKVDHAIRAADAGVDFVIVQGYEGGGHTGEVALSVLLPQVVDAIKGKIPVVAAGGIYDGRGLAASLLYGADGVWIGTRFMMTPEAKTHVKYKERLLKASSDDTMVTKAYTGARLRTLRNPYTTRYELDPSLLEENSALIARRAWDDGCWRLHGGDDSDYEEDVQAYVVGQNIGAINSLMPAAEVVRNMVFGASEVLQKLPSQINHGSRMRTRLCKMLGIKYPIMLAGMGGIASKELVAAVTNAGGFGTWGSAIDVANKGPEDLLEEIKGIQRLCGGQPFGVDILVHGSGEGGVMKQLIKVFSEGGAKAFISGKGFPRKEVIDLFHEKNMLVASISGKLSHAIKAVEAGVDFVIVQGYEGGGHTGEVGLCVLLPQVVDAVGDKVPVVAAGGIYDGRGLAAALAMGAAGVWVGTRFMMTPEAKTHIKYKEKLLKASSDDTTVTKAYTGARLRVLRNRYIAKYQKDPALLETSSAEIARRAWDDGCWRLHGGDASDYDDNVQAYVAGQNIGAISTLKSARTIVQEMVDQADSLLSSFAQPAARSRL